VSRPANTARVAERVLDALRERRWLLQSDAVLPSVASLVANQPIGGSWWSRSELERGSFHSGDEVEGQWSAARVVEAALELGVGVTGVVVERNDSRGAGGSCEGEQVAQ